MPNFKSSLFPETQEDNQSNFTTKCSSKLSISFLLVYHQTNKNPQNRYRELIRVGRQWRNLKERKWFGFGHQDKQPGPAELALFCPACPQPGINLPDNWKDDPEEWLYWRGYVADGNFVAVHLLQPRSIRDVWLKDGEGFMTGRQRYEQHISSAVEIREVSISIVIYPAALSNIFSSQALATNIGQSWTSQNVTKAAMFLVSVHWHVSVMDVMLQVPLSIFRKVKGR